MDAVLMLDVAIRLGAISAHVTLDMKGMDFTAMVTVAEDV